MHEAPTSFIIGSKDRFTTLKDLCLQKWENTLEREEIISAIFKGQITVNGKKGKPKANYRPGARVEWKSMKGKAKPTRAHQIPILHEDEHLLIVDKPSGVAVNGGRGEDLEQILGRFIQINAIDEPLEKVTAVHRIDVPTSGIVVLAKTRPALIKMGHLFAEQEIQKEYHAMVYGHPPKRGRINEPIDNKASITSYQTRSTFELSGRPYALVHVFPKTGRTHQIRKHLLHIGHPIAGDPQYYIPEQRYLGFKQLHLNASAIHFPHPITGHMIDAESTPPKWINNHL